MNSQHRIIESVPFVDMYQLLNFDPSDDCWFKYNAFQLKHCNPRLKSNARDALIETFHYLDCWQLELQTDNALSLLIQETCGQSVDLSDTLSLLSQSIFAS